MPIRLNDDQCILWIKDPSVSPFENYYVQHKRRKNILSEAILKNPRSFLNNIRRKCFYNTTIRQQLVDKIKEYRKKGTLRLYTLNDKLGNLSDIEYMTPPFTRKECERWLSNHLENPRPNSIASRVAKKKTNLKIDVGDRIYTELIYTALQYGLPTPAALNTEPPTLANKFDDNFQKASYKNMNKLITNIKSRLQFIKDNDEYFLNHNVGFFDDKLKVEMPKTPQRKADAIAAINPFGVSSTSSKSLNLAEKRRLRDIILERKEEDKLVAIQQYKKGLEKKIAKNKSSAASADEIDTSRKNIFLTFKELIIDLQDTLKNGNLIENILRYATDEEDKVALTNAITNYFIIKKHYDDTRIKRALTENNYDTIEGILRNFINNIFAQMIDPSTEELPYELEIGVISYSNKLTYFKNFFKSNLYKVILEELYHFIIPYKSSLDKKIYEYYIHIICDEIATDFVAKRKIDVRAIATKGHSYQNYYYKMLYARSEEPKKIRLPAGRGLLIGKELTKKIAALEEPHFNTYPEDRVITDEKVRGFTYEECKNWVILPIFNPRTFKDILIDSPIYNTLLVTSYQYDTDLIPRMITSRGQKILQALTEVIEEILEEERTVAQSLDELEKSIIDAGDMMRLNRQKIKEKVREEMKVGKIGLKWKNAGTKKPKEGTQLMGLNSILKSKGIVADRQPPFYIVLTEDELATTGITNVAKNTYIEIAAYYIPDNSSASRGSRGSHSSKVWLKWKKIIDLTEGEGIEKEGVEINNKKLKDAFLILKSLQGDLRPSVLFRKEDLENFGITTEIAKNSYVKLAYYYKPIFEKSDSDIKIKPKDNEVIKKRDPLYVAYKYYTIGDCLRWARQPKKDPKTQQIILRDSEEYNMIFEQAILYDYNITIVL